jgi:amino acid transporter
MTPLSEKDYFELTHHEDGLINHRLTWLLLAEPILFLAYANLTVAKKVTSGPAVEELLSPRLYQTATTVIPWVGILLAVGILLGILGASIALLLLTERRRRERVPGVSAVTTLLGLAPPLILPLVCIWAWWQCLHP